MKMKIPALMIVGLSIVASPVTSGAAFAAAAETVEYITVEGDVIRYEPGRTIVIRGESNKEMVYSLAPGIVVPAEVQVGQRVTLYYEPSAAGGTQKVMRVVTTSVTPEGNVKRTTEDIRTLPSGAKSKTTTVEVTGRVEAYEAGKMLTVTRADGSRVTYMITAQSKVPTDLMRQFLVNSPGSPPAAVTTVSVAAALRLMAPTTWP
jgi:hypothetical protein